MSSFKLTRKKVELNVVTKLALEIQLVSLRRGEEGGLEHQAVGGTRARVLRRRHRMNSRGHL